MSANPNRRLQIVQQHLSASTDTSTSPFLRAATSTTFRGDALRRLAQRVGGLESLARLDALALPDEPFDWSSVARCDQPRVSSILELVDATSSQRLDRETRTIVYRLLALVLHNDPQPIRRAAKPARVAAALVHAVLEGNGVIGPQEVMVGRSWLVAGSDVAWWFGVSSVTGPARALALAAALPPRAEAAHGDDQRLVQLNRLDLLHSRYRDAIIQRRDMWVEDHLAHEQKQAASRKVVDRGNGHLEVRAVPATFVIAQRGQSEAGRSHLVLGIAPDEDVCNATYYALTIPEARELQRFLDDALDGNAARQPAAAGTPRRSGPSFWPR